MSMHKKRENLLRVLTSYLAIALIAVTSASASPSYPTVVGVAGITDGDTIRIPKAVLTANGKSRDVANVRVRLYGIDAPESNQRCLDAEGKAWGCGREASRMLAQLLSKQTVTCDVHDIDRYQRLVAVCSAPGIPDVNAELVRRGLAVAYRKYSMVYVQDEKVAQAKKIGVWAGVFDFPWDWRKAH
jgi:endonuclease YncB( thermonuclease family)